MSVEHSASAAAPAPAALRVEETTKDEPRGDASPVFLLFLRDLGIGVVFFSIWAGAEAWATVSGLTLATVLSSVGGLFVGLAVAGLSHEWGHFAGARLSGAVAPTAPVGNFAGVFAFDLERSTDAQFRSMSVGGNIAHWTAAWLLFFGLPGATAGQIAIQSGALGFVAFASVVELPVIRRAFSGQSSAEAIGDLVKAPRPILERAGRIGIVTALLLFVVL